MEGVSLVYELEMSPVAGDLSGAVWQPAKPRHPWVNWSGEEGGSWAALSLVWILLDSPSRVEQMLQWRNFTFSAILGTSSLAYGY